MKNKFYCKVPYINLYEKPSTNSSLVSQILYGESFKITKKNKNFLKVKTYFDRYYGYIENKNIYNEGKTFTHKISVLKSTIFKSPINKYKSKQFLPFSSCIKILKKRGNFIEYEKNKWIRFSDIKPLKHKIKNYTKITKLFLNTKYKWGGKTFKGIDCSSLIQIFYKYNNRFFPRDTIDQINYKKGKQIKNTFKAGDLIYWKGHVALCLSSKVLIHAYGPKKKVLMMPINKTIKLIKKTANLKVLKVFSI